MKTQMRDEEAGVGWEAISADGALGCEETYQFGLLQELKTGYKDETDFTTGLELHIRKTNKQEGPRRSSSKNRCTVTGRDIKEIWV
ncbi:hypothetical protein R6Z07F_004197 [Ovis aries]